MVRDPEGVESRIISELLGPQAGYVLEVGCGDGRLTEELSILSGRTIGMDPDPESIRQARSQMSGGVMLVLGAGENIPFVENSFDAVVFSLSLHHHDDPDNALSQARRVLRGDGRILVMEPVVGSLVNRCFKVLHDENDAYACAEAAVKKCGLEPIRSGSYETVWQFDDFEEMVDYLFGRFDMEPDPERTDEMVHLLGGMRDTKPLEIEDVTRYWLFREGLSA